MHSRGHRVLRHLLAWVEGISLSLALACLVSIGILMGWIPISIYSPGDNTAAASLLAPESRIAAEAPVAPGWEGDGVAMSAKCDDCGALLKSIAVINRPRARLPGPIGGATGGAVTGNDIEERVKLSKSYPTADALDDGSTRVSGATGPAQERPGDRKAAVLNEPTLKAAEINVEPFKGAVQPSGVVSSQAAANRAVEVARTVGGVTSVKNDMRIK